MKKKKRIKIIGNTAYEIELDSRELTYTIILHAVRRKLGITGNAYSIADTIYHLSNNPNNKAGGWCYAAKETIGNMLGVSKQTVHNNLNTLIAKGLIEKDPETSNLKTTSKWYDEVILTRTQIGKKFDSP